MLVEDKARCRSLASIQHELKITVVCFHSKCLHFLLLCQDSRHFCQFVFEVCVSEPFGIAQLQEWKILRAKPIVPYAGNRKKGECNAYHDAFRLHYWEKMFFLSAQRSWTLALPQNNTTCRIIHLSIHAIGPAHLKLNSHCFEISLFYLLLLLWLDVTKVYL